VLRVLTWNVRDTRGDRDALVRVLQAARPHVAGLQEVPRWWPWSRRTARLAARAGLHVVAGGWATAGVAVLARPSLRVLDAQAFALPVTGLLTRRRGACVVRLDGSAAGAVTVAALHLGLSQAERDRHVGLLGARLERSAPPVVVVGDLNEHPGSPSWQALARFGRDAAPDGPPTFPAARPRHRIDAVFVDPALRVLSAGFPAGVDVDDVVAASDHRPVLVEVALPGQYS
jgi:endonuclease/exonuclease/phosphatase family metal-dependent hydrolase